MLKVNQEVIKVYKEHLIKTIKEQVKPYLKDSAYKIDKENNWAYPIKHPDETGKTVKACFFKRQVRLKFLFNKKTVVGFTNKEVITSYGYSLEAIYLSNLCVEDLQVLANLDLNSLVKVEKPKQPQRLRTEVRKDKYAKAKHE